jgi:hypothetical protein
VGLSGDFGFAPHTRRTEAQPKHERPDIRPANVLYSCIDRASKCVSARVEAEPSARRPILAAEFLGGDEFGLERFSRGPLVESRAAAGARPH